MKDDKKLELLLERFYNRFNQYNTKVLEKLGEAIKKFDGVSPSTAHKIAQELKYGTDINDLMGELSQLSGKSIKDIEEAFEVVAEENVAFAEVYAKAKNMEFVNYKDNEQLKKLVKGIAGETNATFKNLSKTRAIGFVLKDKKGKKTFKNLKDTYRDLIDEAVFNVETGVSDYQSAMRGVMKQLADSGVKVHEEKIGYPSGYNRRIDSSVRQNVLDGIRKINVNIQEQVGKEFGANAIELSLTFPCADDHAPYEGKIYTHKEFENIQSSLERPFFQWNCRHFGFQVVKGISQPQYTQKYLDQKHAQEHEEFYFEDRKINQVEANDLMRKIETSIRRNKDAQIIGRSAENKEIVANSQQNITALTHKYNELSKISNLPTYKNRLVVSGYRRVNASKLK